MRNPDRPFYNYRNVFPTYQDLPAHARIGIDPGDFREVQGRVEVYILEACLFEDACALFNLAKKYNERIIGGDNIKQNIKIANALYRSTITSSYYLIESYLNGIAFDYFIRAEENLNEKDISLLTEWDTKTKRAKFVSMRDKLLQYPRIILGLEHPPLQESNCKEIKILMGKSKLLRDSIVHATPRYNTKNFDAVKEVAFFSIRYDDVTEIVDNSISLIRIIEERIHGNIIQVKWLHDRNSDGNFDSKVFH